jgi:6-phosphogluconolactonase (cycloisomerase 2 family)
VPLIHGYTVAQNGVLTPIAGSPWTNVMTPAYSLTVEDSFLYVANNDPGSVSAWKIGADGALTQIQGSPFKTDEMFGNNPSWIAFN